MPTPNVISTSPTSGAIEVYTQTQVTVTFDQDMDGSSINTGTFVVYDQNLNILPGTVTYNPPTQTATFSPLAPFFPRDIYTVVLQGGINGIRTVPDVWSEVYYLNNYSWVFTTNDGRFLEPPVIIGPSGLQNIVYPSGVNYGTQFSVMSTTPTNRQSMLDPSGVYLDLNGNPTITICFNKPVDLGSILGSGELCAMNPVRIIKQNILQDPEFVNNLYPIDLTTSGTWSSILWQARFAFNDNGVFLPNEEITVTIPSTIASTDGTVIGSDYSFYFTTRYNPFYIGANRIRLRLGSIIGDVPDDTINRLIYMNSQLANWWSFDYRNEIRPFETTRVTGFEAIVIRPSFTLDPITGLPPLYVQKYVEVKTMLDLLKARYFGLMDQLFLSGGPGASKMLADLRISEGNGSIWSATIGPLVQQLEGDEKGKIKGEVPYWRDWITGANKWKSPVRAQWGRFDPLSNPRRSAFIDGIDHGDVRRTGYKGLTTGMLGGGYGPLPPMDPNQF
jgi:hypothetical protein